MRLAAAISHVEYQNSKGLELIKPLWLTRRWRLLNLVSRQPSLRDDARYFDALLDNVRKMLDFGYVAFFRPDPIGCLQCLCGFVEGSAGIAHNQRVSTGFLIRLASCFQSRVLDRGTTGGECRDQQGCDERLCKM